MPIYKIVFTNDGPAKLGADDEAQDFTYRIDAASADEALGLAEVEFKQKHPQKLHNDYRAHVAATHVDSAERVQHFERSAPLNPDQ